MLDLLLKKLNEGGTYSLAALAHEFDVSQSQVEQMITHLAQMGYLKSITGCEPGHCSGCSSSPSCNTHSFAQLWTIGAQARSCCQEKTPSHEPEQGASVQDR